MNARQETVSHTLGEGCPALPACAYPHAVSALLHGTQADRSDEVPVGYKRTEVGVIPSDWSMYSIGDLFDYLRTASNSRAELGDTGDVAYVHYGDIHTRFHHFIDFSRGNLPRLSIDKGVTANRLREGDLIVADASEDETGVGKSVEVRNLGATEAVAGLHTLLLRPKDLRTHEGYRGYLLEKESVKRQLRSLATGLKVFGISKQALKDVRIPLPSPAEQRTIAEALSDVDGFLTALETLIEKKRAIKRAAMQQLLTGKTRLPGFSGTWIEKRLKDLATITMGQSPPSSSYNSRGDGLPLIQGKTDIANHHTIDRVWTTQVSKRCDSGDLLLTVRAPVGTVAFARKAACLGRGVCGLKPIWSFEFLFHTLLHAEDRWRILEQGSTFTAANSEQVGQFCLHVPTDENEQRAIATVLSEMDTEIAALERHRDKTRAVKQSMKQQLLTGRVRLVKPKVT